MLKRDQLNDFIVPGEVCIKPQISYHKKGSIENVNGQSIAYEDHLVPEKGPMKVAELTLNDCLACSGCITSTETLMLEQHSVGQLHDILTNSDKTRDVVISIAPQVLVSFALKYHMEIGVIFQKLCVFLKLKGASEVVDLFLMNDLSLELSYREFSKAIVEKNEGRLDPSCPFISSHCPGWICYAEKRVSPHILPLINRVKSGQQLMGMLLKKGQDKQRVFHVAIMMCYDKKLEATRDQHVTATGLKEVDTVITANELETWILKEFPTFFDDDNLPVDDLRKVLADSTLSGFDENFNGFLSFDAQGNSGYFEYTLERYRIDLLERFQNVSIEELHGKSKSFTDFVLVDASSNILARFRKAYGFKNIQNALRKLPDPQRPSFAASREPVDFLDMLACPSGCRNGPGLLHARAVGTHKSELEVPLLNDHLCKSASYLSTQHNDFQVLSLSSHPNQYLQNHRDKIERLASAVTNDEYLTNYVSIPLSSATAIVGKW